MNNLHESNPNFVFRTGQQSSINDMEARVDSKNVEKAKVGPGTSNLAQKLSMKENSSKMTSENMSQLSTHSEDVFNPENSKKTSKGENNDEELFDKKTDAFNRSLKQSEDISSRKPELVACKSDSDARNKVSDVGMKNIVNKTLSEDITRSRPDALNLSSNLKLTEKPGEFSLQNTNLPNCNYSNLYN